MLPQALFWGGEEGVEYILLALRVIMLLYALGNSVFFILFLQNDILTPGSKFEAPHVGLRCALPRLSLFQRLPFQQDAREPKDDRGSASGPRRVLEICMIVLPVLPLQQLALNVLRNFVQVSHVGMMRVPRVVLMVLRRAKIRKHLRMMQLIGNMKTVHQLHQQRVKEASKAMFTGPTRKMADVWKRKTVAAAKRRTVVQVDHSVRSQ